MKYAIFLCGSAGAGKSTTTNILKTHFEVCKQHVTVFNFDPAANYLPYEPDFDIRDLITVNEVQEVNKTGPNGSLLFAFDYFFKNESEILEQNIYDNDFEDQILLIDCPGQIELYIQDSNLKKLGNHLEKMEWNIGFLYLIDSTKMIDFPNYLSNLMIAHSVLCNVSMPFQIICTKIDLIEIQKLENFKFWDSNSEISNFENLNENSREIYREISRFCQSIDQNLIYLNNGDEDSISEMAFGVQRLIHFQEE